jgi:two-component system, NarL family, nitrate/nitrite response regulator NarL
MFCNGAPMSKMIRVGIIDDQPLFLDGAIHVLRAQSDMEIMGHAAPIGDVIRLAQENELDVIIAGVTLLDDGVEALDVIVSKYPTVRILVLSDSSDEERICDVLARGISGYLPRSTSGPELVDAVRALNHGIGCTSPTLTRRLLMRSHQGGPSMTKPADRLRTLTRREKQVISMIAIGLSNREIGNKLDLNEGTVKYYVNSILGKLQVRNRVEAALFARSHGVVWQTSDEMSSQCDTTSLSKLTGVITVQ